ncbi:MAG: THUMP domain-containing protein, partial [Candidatus Methanospirareceae archaeon]
MLLLFELSKEHKTLPRAEVLACLDTICGDYKEKAFLEGLLVIEASISAEKLKILANRLAMTHNIYEIIIMSMLKGASKVEEIKEKVSKVTFEEFMKESDSFAVRVKTSPKSFSKSQLEREIGEVIRRKGYKVNLSKPDKVFFVFLKDDLFLFTIHLYSVSKRGFEERKPHLRPFFLPCSMLPKLARAIVNISGVRGGEILLDPFCGTGGILIEAAMIGAKAVGIDVQEKMVRGTKENMRFYGLDGDFIIGDATNMGLKDSSIDVIVTDAPYGR